MFLLSVVHSLVYLALLLIGVRFLPLPIAMGANLPILEHRFLLLHHKRLKANEELLPSNESET
jgi:hypothetical protein